MQKYFWSFFKFNFEGFVSPCFDTGVHVKIRSYDDESITQCLYFPNYFLKTETVVNILFVNSSIAWYLRITHISTWTLLLKYMHTYVCIDIFAFNVKCILQYPMFMDITQVYFQLQLLLIQCLCELMFLLLFCMLTVMPLEALD